MDASDAALYATLLTEGPAGLAFFDRELRCRRANDALAELLGVAVSELQDRTPSEALPEPLAAAFETALRKVIAEDRALTGCDLVVPAGEPPAPPVPQVPPGEPPGARAEAGERILECTWLPARGDDGARPGRRPDRPGRDRAAPGRGGHPPQGAALPLPRGGQRPGGVGRPPRRASVIDDAPEWRAITGQAPDDYAGGGWMSVVHPEDRPRIEAAWRECVQDEPGLRDQLPDPHQERHLPALRRAGRADLARANR